ncbi:MAG: hypothetical protein VW405_17625 [Rhodospirillaceae bacterium]
MPASPQAEDNSKADAERAAAADAAVAERANAGRKSTIVAGMKIAAEDQAERGLLAQQKRQRVSDELGL